MPATFAEPRSSRRHVVAGREIVLPEPGGTLVLRGVSWAEYLRINDEVGGPGVTMTFDRGRLDIEMADQEHEQTKATASLLIAIYATERGFDFAATASTRWDGAGSDRGLESDESYYLKNEPQIRGKRIDLSVDPPPDLAVEIDISRPRPTRQSVYARLGVPELWQWRHGRLRVLRFDAGRYVEVAQSVELPGFPLDLLAEVLDRWPAISQPAAIRQLRQWCDDHPPAQAG